MRPVPASSCMTMWRTATPSSCRGYRCPGVAPQTGFWCTIAMKHLVGAARALCVPTGSGRTASRQEVSPTRISAPLSYRQSCGRELGRCAAPWPCQSLARSARDSRSRRDFRPNLISGDITTCAPPFVTFAPYPLLGSAAPVGHARAHSAGTPWRARGADQPAIRSLSAGKRLPLFRTVRIGPHTSASPKSPGLL
jgi:hypothetical protein